MKEADVEEFDLDVEVLDELVLALIVDGLGNALRTTENW